VDQFISLSVDGIVTAGIYAVAASGLVLTYTTSGVFNFAHGAFGMMAAFFYFELRIERGWPAPLALFFVLFVMAPLFGALIERVIMRGLQDVTEVTRLVVSVGLLFSVFQGAQWIFPERGRNLGGFFQGNFFDLGPKNLQWHDAFIVLSAVLVAIGLRLLLYNTRIGIAMRGVVDDRDLTQLTGGRPFVASMMSWAIGASLAALAGILLGGSQSQLTFVPLTLLVINAYAAAMFGRLRSLPLTFIGALVIGLAEAYAIGYLPLDPVESVFGWHPERPISLAGLRPAIPVILLFLVLLFLPPLRVRSVGLRKSREFIPNPGPRRWLIGTVVLAGLMWILGSVLEGLRVFQLGQGLALGIVMLSLVPLIGYGGQISLAPMAFAGIGAVVMGQFGGEGTIWGLLLAVVVTAAVGAIVALPALRLQGLYLALATAAFAVFMDRMFFNQGLVLPNGNLGVPRLDLPGVSFDGGHAHLVLLGVVFGLVATLIVWLRSGEFGRRLISMKTSPAACVTLGLNLTATKFQVFALSAGIAGLGGALYAAQLRSIDTNTFAFLQSLPVLLLAVTGGIAAVGGALFGGFAYALGLRIIPDLVPSLQNLLLVAPGFAAISLGRNPNGAVNETVRSFREQAAARRSRAEGAPEPDWDRLGLDAGFTIEELDRLDHELALDEERAYSALRAGDGARAGEEVAGGAVRG